ncbi:hypothetical protein ABI59_21775 [Acidobacteria bacterium Mor1]|nr:hypothetical protein ABI59_21775 [Acidobacteria bacterium Mor1]
MSDAIVLRNLVKTFGEKTAVRDMNLTVPKGSLYGFIGPNGAGKTTTIRMIMSILFPDKGDISVLGRKSALEAKDRIGYLPEERGVYKKMKVKDFLLYMAQLKGTDPSGLRKRIRLWLDKVELPDVDNKRCEELSKGMQQKVQFIASVIHKPDLLILDEPFSGLDPVNMRLLRDLIYEQHKKGTTIIFSTHVMVQAEELCDHLVMIHNGDKVLDDTLEGIRARFDPRSVVFEPLDASADVKRLGELPEIASVRRDRGHWELGLTDGATIEQAIQQVTTAMVPLRIEVNRPSLEDVFVQIAGTAEGQEELRAQVRDESAVTVG